MSSFAFATCIHYAVECDRLVGRAHLFLYAPVCRVSLAVVLTYVGGVRMDVVVYILVSYVVHRRGSLTVGLVHHPSSFG